MDETTQPNTQEEHMSGSMDVMGSISPAAHALDRAQAELRTPDPLFPVAPIAGAKGTDGPTSRDQQGQETDDQETAQPNTPDANQDAGQAAEHPQPDTTRGTQDAGQVTSTPAPGDAAGSGGPPASQREPLEDLVHRVSSRLMRRDDWFAPGGLSEQRDEMFKLTRKRLKSKDERRRWVYSELDRMYPPEEEKQAETVETEKGSKSLTPDEAGSSEKRTKGSNRTVSYSTKMSGITEGGADDGQIQGLGAIPDGWPELPANASLSAEIGWVQANRLRIIEDKPMGPTLVHLDRALSPAPSWAALGWLETSIRSYAKYVDVAAKATAADDGEAAVVKRERMAIEDVCTLLDEMREG